MLFSRNLLNSKDWLDVIFAGRNKDYGAYQLRQYSNKATNVALIIVLLIVVALCSLSFIPSNAINGTHVEPISDLSNNNEHLFEEEKVFEVDIATVEEKTTPNPQQVAQDVSAKDVVKLVEINPTSSPEIEDITSVSEVMNKKVLVGNINAKGMKGGELIPKGTFGNVKRDGGVTGSRIGDPDGSSNNNLPFEVVEIMPMPPGGMAAFVQWVGKNYRFTGYAVQNEVQGLVKINFVVEKDGSLSSFEVQSDIGFGTGEEAIRLLQKAKKWSPGIQNGVPVRVSYSLPIRLSTLQP